MVKTKETHTRRVILLLVFNLYFYIIVLLLVAAITLFLLIVGRYMGAIRYMCHGVGYYTLHFSIQAIGTLPSKKRAKTGTFGIEPVRTRAEKNLGKRVFFLQKPVTLSSFPLFFYQKSMIISPSSPGTLMTKPQPR